MGGSETEYDEEGNPTGRRVRRRHGSRDSGGTHEDSNFAVRATDPMQIDDIKAKVNTGLADADGSKNARIVKKQLDLMKNPIISAIKKTLRIQG